MIRKYREFHHVKNFYTENRFRLPFFCKFVV